MKLKLTVGSLIRLTLVAAIALSLANWWPRASESPDGSTSWYYRSWNGRRQYYVITGQSPTGGSYKVLLGKVPGYGKLLDYYPSGKLRAEADVFVNYQTDGVKCDRESVTNGRYYSTSGEVLGSVEKGTGSIVYTRDNGERYHEIILQHKKIVGRRTWFRNGNLAQESIDVGDDKVEVSQYYPEGMIESSWTSDRGRVIDKRSFDRKGNETETPEAYERIVHF